MQHSHPAFEGLTPIDTRDFGHVLVIGARRRAVVLLAARRRGIDAGAGVWRAAGRRRGLTAEGRPGQGRLFTPVNVRLVKNGSVKWKWVNTIITPTTSG